MVLELVRLAEKVFQKYGEEHGVEIICGNDIENLKESYSHGK